MGLIVFTQSVLKFIKHLLNIYTHIDDQRAININVFAKYTV